MNKKSKLKIRKQNNSRVCRDYELMFKRFIDGELSEEDDLDFSHHMLICDKCLDSLKEYYMFATAFHYLDNHENASLPADVTELIKEVTAREAENKRRTKITVFIIVSSVTVISFLISILIEGFWWI